MAKNTHAQMFRPIRGGIRIINARVPGNSGTLGCVCENVDGSLWILSCMHVLVRPRKWEGVEFAPGEPILQPGRPIAAGRIATTVSGRADRLLDCAAALLDDGVSSVPEVLGVGELFAPQAPVVGMGVIKSGARTGVTEGRIVKVGTNRVVIHPPIGAPSGFELSAQGDSGALWIERESGAPVALHRSGNRSGTRESAIASPIPEVLAALSLRILGT